MKIPIFVIAQDLEAKKDGKPIPAGMWYRLEFDNKEDWDNFVRGAGMVSAGYGSFPQGMTCFIETDMQRNLKENGE